MADGIQGMLPHMMENVIVQSIHDTDDRQHQYSTHPSGDHSDWEDWITFPINHVLVCFSVALIIITMNSLHRLDQIHKIFVKQMISAITHLFAFIRRGMPMCFHPKWTGTSKSTMRGRYILIISF